MRDGKGWSLCGCFGGVCMNKGICEDSVLAQKGRGLALGVEVEMMAGCGVVAVVWKFRIQATRGGGGGGGGAVCLGLRRILELL